MKRLGVFLLPPGWDASPSQGYPQHYAGTHLYTWVERGNVRVKCLAQEHNTMSPARTRTRTMWSRVEHTDHEATVPIKVYCAKIPGNPFECSPGHHENWLTQGRNQVGNQTNDLWVGPLSMLHSLKAKDLVLLWFVRSLGEWLRKRITTLKYSLWPWPLSCYH